MSEDERPLPRPKKTPFGVNRDVTPDEAAAPLTADLMAMAMSQGSLDEFIKKELPDNEYAKMLAQMMMSMTGMMPPGITIPEMLNKQGHGATAQSVSPDSAAESDDEISDILKKQFREKPPSESSSASEDMSFHPEAQGSIKGTIDKQMLEDFMNIASDNNLSIDWLLLRAVRLFVEDYKKTGRL